MANKKISELESRASLSLSDLMAVGDPSTGYLYKTTISDLKTLTGAGVVSFNGRFGTVNPAEGDYTLTQLGDVIITSPSNNQLLQYNGSNWVNWTPNYLTAETDTLNSVTTRGNTTGNIITVGGITSGSQSAQSYHTFYSSNVNDGSAMTIAAENASANSSRSHLLLTDLSGGASKRFGIGVYTGASPYSYLDASTKLVFQQSGGNVIVGGIVDAGYKFDVNGTVRFTGNLTLTDNANLVTSNQFYGLTTNYTNGIFVGWDASAVYLGYKMGALPIHLGTDGTGEIRFRNTGGFKIDSFSGSGSRMVVADANGVLSTQAIPSTTGFVTLDTFQTITASKTFSVGFSLASAGGSNQLAAFANTNSIHSGSAGSNIFGFNNSNNIYFGKGLSNGGVIAWNNSAVRSYTLPDATGTIALTSDIPSLSNYVTLDGTQTITGLKTFTNVTTFNQNIVGGLIKLSQGMLLSKSANIGSDPGFLSVIAQTTTGLNYINFVDGDNFSFFQRFAIPNTATYTYTFPSSSGTLALASSLSSYLPLSGGTLTGALNGTSGTFTFTGGVPALNVRASDANFALASIFGNQAGDVNWLLMSGFPVAGDFTIRQSDTVNALTIKKTTGAATFSSTVTANTTIAVSSADTLGTNVNIINTSAGGYNWNIFSGGSSGTLAPVGSLIFRDSTNGATRMIINTAGNVGIGTTNPGDSRLQINGTHPSGNAIVRIQAVSDDTSSLGLFGTSGTRRGLLYYSAGVVGLETNSDPLMLATNGSERMRITSGGLVGIGTSSVGYTFHVQKSVSGNVLSMFYNDANSGADTALITRLGSNCNNTNSYYFTGGIYGVADKIYIYGNGNIVNTNNSYGAISDIRLKENITDTASKLSDLLKVKVRNYNLIGDEKKQIGVIAQELETIFPSMIEVDGKSGMKQVKYSVFVPMLIKAIQEQQAQIEQLKSK